MTRDARKFYETLIDPLREVAKAHGYALAVHGSLSRDLDLIACPWSEGAVPQHELAEAIRAKAAELNPVGVALIAPHENDEFHRDGCPGMKPHGRLCWSFHLGGGPYIDLSVMPRTVPPHPVQATDRKRCSGVRSSGYWKGYACGAVAKYEQNGHFYCKNHLPIHQPQSRKEQP